MGPGILGPRLDGQASELHSSLCVTSSKQSPHGVDIDGLANDVARAWGKKGEQENEHEKYPWGHHFLRWLLRRYVAACRLALLPYTQIGALVIRLSGVPPLA
jgi:hypothetical protein